MKVTKHSLPFFLALLLGYLTALSIMAIAFRVHIFPEC
jgi:hypothetical protein